ncbi:MAG: P-II family nitrogen regulator [Nitrospinaceae bacterium]
MKQIKAYIKPHKLSQVTRALHKVDGLTGMSVTEVKGFGRSRAKNAPHRIIEDFVEYVPHVKIEIVCENGLLDTIVRTIQENAHTGLRGDGKIYILAVEDAIRIENGDRGEHAC